jgi:Fe2+ or Zn2+ uptake regulation protein
VGWLAMNVAFNPLLTKTLKRQESVRNEIMQVLEENSDGLPVTAICRQLKANGHFITPQAISQSLATLEKTGLVWKTKRLNKEVNRDLQYYFSSSPFFNCILEEVKHDLALSISKSMERNWEKAGPFTDFRVLQDVLENTILFAAQSVIFSKELYDELGKTKHFEKSAVFIKDYATAISNVCNAIVESRLMYEQRRYCLGLTASLALGQPFDMAKAIIDGAINEEKKSINAMFFLEKKAKGELRERIETSLKWIECTFQVKLTSRSRKT